MRCESSLVASKCHSEGPPWRCNSRISSGTKAERCSWARLSGSVSGNFILYLQRQLLELRERSVYLTHVRRKRVFKCPVTPPFSTLFPWVVSISKHAVPGRAIHTDHGGWQGNQSFKRF